MANTKPIAAALLILLSLAMFALVTTNAAATPCPNLSACISIANDLLKYQVGAQSNSACCQLIGGLVSANTGLCLCNSLNTTLLGSVVADVLGLTNGLPLFGSTLPILSSLPIIGSLPLNVLNQEMAVFVNACGLNTPQFTCA